MPRAGSPFTSRVTEKISELLKQGVVPWQKPWNAHVGPPRNGVSGRFYRGLNIFMLSHAGFDSPWWFSPKQVNDLDAHIRKGEKVSWAHFFKPWLPKGESTEIFGDRRAGRGGFHPPPAGAHHPGLSGRQPGDQIEGPGADKFRHRHPPAERIEKDNDPIAGCEQIVEAMPQRPVIRYGGDRAFYRPWADEVHVPRREHFMSSEHFYGTLFHELVHSTGHSERLSRKTLTDGVPFGSPTYSREELVAEMGAAFLCSTAGIEDPTIRNSASYLQSWLKFLRSDPQALVIAGAQAQKAADSILGAAGVEHVEAEAEQVEAEA